MSSSVNLVSLAIGFESIMDWFSIDNIDVEMRTTLRRRLYSDR